ncbi:MAG: glycosyltransferase [Actinobacteria bacterium]|nr:glycosyltransferase [Actinomycetota bacterium]
MKITIIHDYLNQYGGAERVVEVLHEIFPKAPIYTSIYLKDNMPESFRKMDIRTSYMQKFPLLNKHFKKYLLFYSRAIESFNLKEYDLVISSSSAFAKGAVKGSGAYHVCYCYTPMRFVWDYENYVKKENFGKIPSFFLPLMIKKLKKWDLKTIGRVDLYIAISKNIRDRIKRVYNVEAEYVYPPVNVTQFKISEDIKDYFLIVSRLNSYKNIDLVIKVFNMLKLNLKIVGTGPYRKSLEDLVKSDRVEFLGKVSENELIKLYSECKAFIFPGVEDFGIAPLEAQASGRPVIAFAGGGALETVVDGVTGLFFKDNSIVSLTDAIKRFFEFENKFNPEIIRKNALKFDTEIFKTNIKNLILEKYDDFKKIGQAG